MALLALSVALALGVSFVCALLEAALQSITPAYAGQLMQERPALAERLKALKADGARRPRAALLALTVLAATFGAAGAGVQADRLFGPTAALVTAGALALGLVVAAQLLPRAIGAAYGRALAPALARGLPPLMALAFPFVALAQALRRLLPAEPAEEVSRDELVALADAGAEQGVIEGRERQILEHLLRFRTLHVHDVMTPRTVLVAYPEATTAAEAAERGLPFSRLPVYAADRDHVTGYVLEDDVLTALAEGRGAEPLAAFRRDVLTVPESLPLPDLFDRLLARRQHLALVVDEYGGTAGVATMEDVVETLLGLEILDEADRATDMQALARSRWARRAARMGLNPDGLPDASESLPALLSNDPQAAGEMIEEGMEEEIELSEEAARPRSPETPARPGERGGGAGD